MKCVFVRESEGGKEKETHGVEAWGKAIFNWFRQPDRVGLYIVRQRSRLGNSVSVCSYQGAI